jgi:DNA-binding NarL/FixJ family response regulator
VNPTRVFVVGGVRLYCEGVVRLLASDRSLQVLGFGPPDERSLRRIAAAHPRVLVVDSKSALEADAVRKLSAASPGCAVVVIAMKEDENDVFGCAEAGVGGYVREDASAEEFAQSIREIARGEFPCPPRIAAMLFRHVATAAALDRAGVTPSHLTAREREIVALIDRGLRNKEIAEALSIEIATVKNHVHHVLGKLGVATRVAAAASLRDGIGAPRAQGTREQEGPVQQAEPPST